MEAFSKFRAVLNGVLLFSFAVIITFIPACKKTDTPAPGGGSTGYGNAMIWTKNGTLGNVTVTCNGEVAIISKYYSTGQPSGCGVTGFANFRLPVGTYSFQATNTAGVSWNGSITVTDGQCTLQELTYGGGGVQPLNTIGFWTANSTYGKIDVSIGGMTLNLTKYFTSGAPSSCSVTGVVTFGGPTQTYSYSATSQSGRVWSGTVTNTSACTLIQLN